MAQEYEFHYDFMTDNRMNSNTYGEKADIFCRESDSDMYDLAKMRIKAEIPYFDGEKIEIRTVYGFYGEITDKLYKQGFRW